MGSGLFCKIEISEDGKLSITGVEGPKSNGDSYGSCGQIDMGYFHRNQEHNDKRYSEPKKLSIFNDGWNEKLWLDFLEVWHERHLNDMTAACEHQRQLGWTYESHHDPKTFKGENCPVCGYSIGSQCLKRELPASVISFLSALPETKKQPAWV